jgi:hypothetical protein
VKFNIGLIKNKIFKTMKIKKMDREKFLKNAIIQLLSGKEKVFQDIEHQKIMEKESVKLFLNEYLDLKYKRLFSLWKD